MNNMKYSYAREKLGVAIETMAIGEGDVRQRLLQAYMSFHPLNSNHFPQEFQERWEWIEKQITKFGPEYDYKGEPVVGSVENTMKKIRKATGTKIAVELYALNWELHNNEKYL